MGRPCWSILVLGMEESRFLSPSRSLGGRNDKGGMRQAAQEGYVVPAVFSELDNQISERIKVPTLSHKTRQGWGTLFL